MGAINPSTVYRPEGTNSDIANGLQKWRISFGTTANSDTWDGSINGDGNSAFAGVELVDLGTVNVVGSSILIAYTKATGTFVFVTGGSVTSFDMIFWTRL